MGTFSHQDPFMTISIRSLLGQIKPARVPATASATPTARASNPAAAAPTSKAAVSIPEAGSPLPGAGNALRSQARAEVAAGQSLASRTARVASSHAPPTAEMEPVRPDDQKPLVQSTPRQLKRQAERQLALLRDNKRSTQDPGMGEPLPPGKFLAGVYGMVRAMRAGGRFTESQLMALREAADSVLLHWDRDLALRAKQAIDSAAGVEFKPTYEVASRDIAPQLIGARAQQIASGAKISLSPMTPRTVRQFFDELDDLHSRAKLSEAPGALESLMKVEAAMLDAAATIRNAAQAPALSTDRRAIHASIVESITDQSLSDRVRAQLGPPPSPPPRPPRGPAPGSAPPPPPPPEPVRGVDDLQPPLPRPFN